MFTKASTVLSWLGGEAAKSYNECHKHGRPRTQVDLQFVPAVDELSAHFPSGSRRRAMGPGAPVANGPLAAAPSALSQLCRPLCTEVAFGRC